MTKEEIITRLQNAAKEDEEYYMDDDLIDAINEYPEPFELVEPNIWMVHRCFNDVNNPKREMFVELMKELKDDSSISMDIKKEIDEFDWEI